MNTRQILRAGVGSLAMLDVIASTTILAPTPAAAHPMASPAPDLVVTFASEFDGSTFSHILKEKTYSFVIANKGLGEAQGTVIASVCFYHDLGNTKVFHTSGGAPLTVGSIPAGGKQVVQFTREEEQNLGPSGAKLMVATSGDANSSNNSATSPGFR